MDSIRGTFGYYDKRTYFVEAPVILHIHIVDETDNDTQRYSYPHELLKCVTARVVTKIKGRHMQMVKSNSLYAPDSFVHITYYPKIRRTGRTDEGNWDPSENDALEPGRDYIVFLENEYNGYNGRSSFYKYTPYSFFYDEHSILVFPIDENGNVLIPSNYFGYGTKVPLKTFEADLKADIQSIVSN
jgi:hypothetical protein